MAGARGLLAFMNVLWLVQSSLPLLDRRVPSLFSLPLSQILAMVLGVAVAVCANHLLGALNGDGRPLGANTRSIFSVLSGLWATGVGLHACANAVEKELTEEDHALYPLVHDHLHELWSHQMLQSAYLGLLLLLLWTETASGPENHDQFHRRALPTLSTGRNCVADCSRGGVCYHWSCHGNCFCNYCVFSDSSGQEWPTNSF